MHNVQTFNNNNDDDDDDNEVQMMYACKGVLYYE